MRSFQRDEQARVEAAYRAGEPLVCPTCAVPLDQRPIEPVEAVSYVRRRLLLTCPSCHGHMVLDRSEER